MLKLECHRALYADLLREGIAPLDAERLILSALSACGNGMSEDGISAKNVRIAEMAPGLDTPGPVKSAWERDPIGIEPIKSHTSVISKGTPSFKRGIPTAPRGIDPMEPQNARIMKPTDPGSLRIHRDECWALATEKWIKHLETMDAAIKAYRAMSRGARKRWNAKAEKEVKPITLKQAIIDLRRKLGLI